MHLTRVTMLWVYFWIYQTQKPSTVWRGVLLFRKLEYYGIRSVELEWFKSYFDDRKQIVCYKGVRSKPMRTNFGVGQSSICGPISFCIFMNDLCRCSNILSFVMYADDTCVYNVGSDVNENMRMMNIELQRVSERMRSNCLTLNYKKKNVIILYLNVNKDYYWSFYWWY